MPGILEDLGIISNGKLTKNTYSGFVADVRRRLRTGLGILKSPDLGKPTEPISLHELAQIEKQFLFPEFHSIWRERYEKMVRQLNVPGGFGVAATTFLIDPVALAKAMGAKETPQVKFPDILFEIQGLPPPDGPPAKPPTLEDVMNDPASVKSVDFFDRYLKDIDPLDPSNITNLMNIINAVPVPIKPEFPDPRLLRYGYTERFTFENKVYNSHRSTHGTMLTQAITLIPNTIVEMSSGAGCYSLMKATRETAELTQPKPMSTSVFEIAAQEILLQHQIKLESAIILGQMLGSGAILQALAATPEETGGLGIINTSTSQQSETTGGQSTITNSSTVGGNSSSGGSSVSTSSTQTTSAPGGQGLGFAKPPDDVPPPGGQTTKQDEFDEYSQQEGSSGVDQSQGQQTSGTPSGFGFGGPGEDVPPGDGEGQADLYPTSSGGGGPAGSPDQNQPFGFSPPPDDVPPPAGSDGEGNGSGTGYNQSQSSTEEPYPDTYPPDGSGQGQQTYPQGYGDVPPDVGEERPYKPPPAPPEETLGELQGTSPPNAYDSNDDDSPADIKEVDIEKLYIPEPSTTKYDSGDEDDDVVDNKSSSNSFAKNLSSVRKRIKDLIEGGATCPADGGYIGGILGPPPDWASATPGFATSNATFRGVKGGPSNKANKEWASVIPGARKVIGGGYLSYDEIKNIKSDPSNTTQSKATTCTVLPGWLIENLLFSPDDPGSANDLVIMLDSSSDGIVLGNGFPYPKSQVIGGPGGNKIVPASGGLGAPPYLAALLDAWVNVDPGNQNVNPNSPPGNPNKKPKYGDIYLFRDNDKMLRHIGAIVAWNAEGGWIGTADLGQGLISNNEQGMAYCKRSTQVGDNGAVLVPGEAAQGDQNNKRILMGWIDMDVLIKKLLMMNPDLYVSRNKPHWI